jgi:hypothetical protein
MVPWLTTPTLGAPPKQPVLSPIRPLCPWTKMLGPIVQGGGATDHAQSVARVMTEADDAIDR